MRLVKDNLAVSTLFWYEKHKCWLDPSALKNILLRWCLTRMAPARREYFFGVPVFFIEGNEDFNFSKGREDFETVWALMQSSALLVDNVSPFWGTQVKNVFRSIKVQRVGHATCFDRRDGSWSINPSKLTGLQGQTAILSFTARLIMALCLGLMYQGRFGYVGFKHREYFGLRAIARFLRKSDSDANSTDLLSWCYRRIDNLRPGRHHYDRFVLEKLGRVNE